MMTKPYGKPGDVTELVSSLGWMEEDLSSQDGDRTPEIGHYALHKRPVELDREDMEEDDEEEEEEEEEEMGLDGEKDTQAKRS